EPPEHALLAAPRAAQQAAEEALDLLEGRELLGVKLAGAGAAEVQHLRAAGGVLAVLGLGGSAEAVLAEQGDLLGSTVEEAQGLGQAPAPGALVVGAPRVRAPEQVLARHEALALEQAA